MRLDRLFELEDGSYLIVDYESDYDELKMSKYLGYIARLSKMLYNKLKRYPNIRVLIVYTADVTRRQTNPYLNIGSVVLHIEEAFLSELDSDSLWKRIYSQVKQKRALEDLELMQMIIYPLTFKKKSDKRSAIQQAIDIIDEIDSDKQRIFLLKGLLVFCDKVILNEDAEKIRRMLMLTKVEQIIEKEKQDAIEEATRNVRQDVAINLLNSGSSPEFVATNTGLSLDYVKNLAVAE